MYQLSRDFPLITERIEYKELIALWVTDQRIRRFIKKGWTITEIRNGEWIENEWKPKEIYILIKN